MSERAKGADTLPQGDLRRAYRAYQEAAAKHRAVQERARCEVTDARAAELEAHKHWREQRAAFYRRAFKDGIITRAMVDVLAPTHRSARCSDEKQDRDGCCARCYMLQALADPYIISEEDVFSVSYTRDRA